MREFPTDNRPEFQVVEVMRQLAEGQGANGGRFPNPGPLSRQPVYPGNGYPQNPGENRPGMSPFGRLGKGQPLGKSSILRYSATGSDLQAAAVPILRAEGDDLDASQLCITLAPPRVIPLAFLDAIELNEQNQTGEQDNGQVSGGNFPGDVAPIKWPPIEAIIEWGIKGASAKAIVDFTNGCTVNVIASYVNVYAAVTQSEASGEIAGTSALYYLSAFVGPGWTKTGTAKRTIYIGTVAPNVESDVFAIPAFARRATIVGCDVASPPSILVGYLRFWQSPDGNAGGTNVGNFIVSANQPGPFDVPNGAQYVTVYNQSGVAQKISVVFELAL